jgi:hypothetical protein
MNVVYVLVMVAVVAKIHMQKLLYNLMRMFLKLIIAVTLTFMVSNLTFPVIWRLLVQMVVLLLMQDLQ